MSGKAGRSGRKPRIVPGVFKPPAHLPPTAPPVWKPSDAQLALVGADGRALIGRLRRKCEYTALEGEQLVEAAIACDRLGDLRRERRAVADPKRRLALLRAELAWQKQYTALLAPLLQVRPS